jgi:hypothetical protein
MYMQHVESGVGGKTRSRAFEVLDGEADSGKGVAKEPKAKMKLRVAREGRYMVVMKGLSVVGRGVY